MSLIPYMVVGLVCGGFTAWLALNKDRSVGAWFVLGFLFNIFALIAIAAAPKSADQSADD